MQVNAYSQLHQNAFDLGGAGALCHTKDMTEIDGFLQHVPKAQRQTLEHIRDIVRRMVPDAEERISYGIPSFKYKNHYMIGFAAYKDHLSLFPSSEPIEFFKDQLKEFTTSKGTIQFSVDHPLPDTLIEAIVQHRLDAMK